MWLKTFSIILLFYFLAIIQNSFFSQFVFLGGFLNLVFVLYFVIVFFSEGEKQKNIIIYSLASGFFLDVFLDMPFGVSILSILVTGFLVKKIQSSLQGKNDKYPVFYFVPIFIICFFIYSLLSVMLANIFGESVLSFGLSWSFMAGIVYNLCVAVISFYFYKNFILKRHV